MPHDDVKKKMDIIASTPPILIPVITDCVYGYVTRTYAERHSRQEYIRENHKAIAFIMKHLITIKDYKRMEKWFELIPVRSYGIIFNRDDLIGRHDVIKYMYSHYDVIEHMLSRDYVRYKEGVDKYNHSAFIHAAIAFCDIKAIEICGNSPTNTYTTMEVLSDYMISSYNRPEDAFIKAGVTKKNVYRQPPNDVCKKYLRNFIKSLIVYGSFQLITYYLQDVEVNPIIGDAIMYTCDNYYNISNVWSYALCALQNGYGVNDKVMKKIIEKWLVELVVISRNVPTMTKINREYALKYTTSNRVADAIRRVGCIGEVYVKHIRDILEAPFMWNVDYMSDVIVSMQR